MTGKTKTVIIGKSKAIKYVLGFISKAAESSLPVLIEGESGTGKELVAASIHEQSKRSDNHFIAINCGAMPKDLLENELFGHEAGAFTGATAVKRGLFEVADGGTLFIDEIGELDISSQVKLLRVLETGKFRRLGSTKEIAVDVRIITATNKVLEKQISDGAFRPDLYYRISVLRAFLPALRDRKEDIRLLAEYYLEKKINPALPEGKPPLTLDESAVEALEKYGWPGNIRELQNVLSITALMSKGARIGAKDLPEPPKNCPARVLPDEKYAQISLKEFLDGREKDYISFLMNELSNDKDKIRTVLGISRAQFYRKLGKYNLF